MGVRRGGSTGGHHNLSPPVGEQTLAWAPGVRKGLEPELPGTLICTNLRVTFQPCGWRRSQVRWLGRRKRLRAGDGEEGLEGFRQTLQEVRQ